MELQRVDKGNMDIKQDPKPHHEEIDSVTVKVFDPHRWLLDFEQEKPLKKASPGGPAKRRTSDEMMMWNLISSVADFLIVGVLLFLFVWGLAQVMQVSVKVAMGTLWQISQGGTLLLVLSLLWIYHVACPALLTYTPGQWACQITRTPQNLTFRWVIRATLRLLALFMTGFILLPLFSWASGQDLEGQLTGLKVYTK